MRDDLANLAEGLDMTGDIRSDTVALLTHHGCQKTIVHSMRVAEEARRLAERWNEDAGWAEIAGWLHDISAIVPNDQRILMAESLCLEILPEERAFPMIIHQKLSAAIAAELFNVCDEPILSAIGCHTTLKANAANLDKILFVADKVAWDQDGDPPYINAILERMNQSLDQAALAYLQFLWHKRNELPVLHPWVEQAYLQLA